MITSLVILLMFFIWFMYKRRIALNDLDKYILKRMESKKRLKNSTEK